MKIPHKTTKKPSSSQKDQNQDQPQHQQNLQTYNISIKDIQSTVQTIKKIKHISKKNQTKFKKQHKQFNQLFAIMSSFFTNKNKKDVKDKKKLKLQRIQKRKKLLQQKVKQIKQQYQDNIDYIFKSQNNNVNPQIVQQIQKDQNQFQQHKPLKICYICLKTFTQVDNLYLRHCPTCSIKSKQKRFQTANLNGMNALVTGARIKIGYQITLKLLRDGATVYATSRFINDALLRYQKQNDYDSFKNRLFLIQCDFLASDQVNSLIKYMKQNVQRLDILIHNAAQTLTRPIQFYKFQLQNQAKQLKADPTRMITFQNKTHPSLQLQNNKAICYNGTTKIDINLRDQFGQPLDLRQKNTWRQKIEDVSLFDCMSTQVINSTVPFFITGQLKSIMGGDLPSWVINVSSMQGVFYRANKTCYHPQTNMAKASLNMITRTCSEQFSKNNIYMSSVDTGWITNQNPFSFMVNMRIKHDFLPPLDCIQGAMRVLDPIYQGVRDGKLISGKFLKNYEQSSW